MKKIAIISQGLSNGGAERVAALLANNFYKQGNEVLFIAVYSDEKEYKLNDNIKYVYINVEAKNNVSRLIKRSNMIDKELEKFLPDVAISFTTKEMIITNIKARIPIIYSLRNDPGCMLKSFFDRFLCKVSYRRAKNIVFQTPGARDYFENKIRQKGVVIGNPLTSNLPYWKDKEHSKTIITACRLMPQKNLKMLIDGFKEFHINHEDYILEIYGKGPLQEELEEYCKDMGINKFIKFKGHSKEIHKIMSESAIFALTSDYEGLSNSMLEALAIGIPTVCTNCPPGGAAQYIEDGINGMLVPVGNAEELAKKLSILADDTMLCKNFSNNSIKIRDILNEDTIMKKWNEII